MSERFKEFRRRFYYWFEESNWFAKIGAGILFALIIGGMIFAFLPVMTILAMAFAFFCLFALLMSFD